MQRLSSVYRAQISLFPRSFLGLQLCVRPACSKLRRGSSPRRTMSDISNHSPAAVADSYTEKKTQATPTPNGQVNAWASPGRAAFDFRSDVFTTPTTSMLDAIAATTLGDDVFLEDPTTASLESFVASLTGFTAGLLVLSGTMANQVALRAHLLGPPHSVLCDDRAHIVHYEAGGVATLSQALVHRLVPANGHHLTLEEVKKNAVISDDVHACPTRVISLENTLGGTVMPLAETRRISEWARAQDPPIIMHLDGARLWEVASSGAGSLKDYCACFDSVSLCFSKGLGAPIGSIVVGSEKFIKRSRWIRKSIGGGLRQAGVIAAAARVSVEETFLGGKLKKSHENAKKIEKIWVDLGGKLNLPVETNMVWLDLEQDGGPERFTKVTEEEGVTARGERLVVHYQIGDEAIARMEKAMKRIRASAGSSGDGVNGH